MLGRRPEPQLALFCYLPEVPATRLAAKLAEAQAAFDWDAVRARAEAYFAPRVGRPSLDPVVVVKLLLLHKLCGGPSWRALVELASDSLAARRFLGYELHEELPSHQALSDWRQRLGPEFFEDLLIDVVLHCVREGMRLSTVRVVDATAVKAQADRSGPVLELSTQVSEAEAWLAAVGPDDEDDDEPDPLPPHPRPRDADTPRPKQPAPAPTRVVNTHDPDARLSRKPGQTTEFRYQTSFCSDPYSGLVVTTIVKGTEEPWSMVEHVDRDPGTVTTIVGDKHYDSCAGLAALAARGVEAVVPAQHRHRGHGFAHEQFVYDPGSDGYTCPAGARLTHCSTKAEGTAIYRASVTACRECRLKAWCTRSDRRSITVPAGAAGRGRALRRGPRYQQLMGLRRTQEHLWLVAKRDYGLARADALGLGNARASAALVAVCINLGKLAQWRLQAEPVPPAGAVVVGHPTGVAGLRASRRALSGRRASRRDWAARAA